MQGAQLHRHMLECSVRKAALKKARLGLPHDGACLRAVLGDSKEPGVDFWDASTASTTAHIRCI